MSVGSSIHAYTGGSLPQQALPLIELSLIEPDPPLNRFRFRYHHLAMKGTTEQRRVYCLPLTPRLCHPALIIYGTLAILSCVALVGAPPAPIRLKDLTFVQVNPSNLRRIYYKALPRNTRQYYEHDEAAGLLHPIPDPRVRQAPPKPPPPPVCESNPSSFPITITLLRLAVFRALPLPLRACGVRRGVPAGGCASQGHSLSPICLPLHRPHLPADEWQGLPDVEPEGEDRRLHGAGWVTSLVGSKFTGPSAYTCAHSTHHLPTPLLNVQIQPTRRAAGCSTLRTSGWR